MKRIAYTLNDRLNRPISAHTTKTGVGGTEYRVVVDDNGYLQVDVIASGLPAGAATEASLQGIEDCVASLANDYLLMGGWDSVGGVPSILEVSGGGELYTHITDGTRDALVATASAINNPNMDGQNALLVHALLSARIDANTTYGLLCDNAGHLQVDIVAMPTVTIQDGGGSITIDGTITGITNDVSIDDGGNSITIDGTVSCDYPQNLEADDNAIAVSENHESIIGLLYAYDGTDWGRVYKDVNRNSLSVGYNIELEDNSIPISEYRETQVNLLYGYNGSDWERLHSDGSGALMAVFA